MVLPSNEVLNVGMAPASLDEGSCSVGGVTAAAVSTEGWGTTRQRGGVVDVPIATPIPPAAGVASCCRLRSPLLAARLMVVGRGRGARPPLPLVAVGMVEGKTK